MTAGTMVHVHRWTRSGRWWSRRREEIRSVPGDYLPFANAFLSAHYAKDALNTTPRLAALLHIPVIEAAEMIDAAIWDAAGAALQYLEIRREAWGISLSAAGLAEDDPLRCSAEAACAALGTHAAELDRLTTDACARIRDTCAQITRVRDEMGAASRIRIALRQADRHGAYSTAPELIPLRTQELSDRVAGLVAGLREMAAA